MAQYSVAEVLADLERGKKALWLSHKLAVAGGVTVDASLADTVAAVRAISDRADVLSDLYPDTSTKVYAYSNFITDTVEQYIEQSERTK